MTSAAAKPDLVIRNARLIDGMGAPSVLGDVAIADDRIYLRTESKLYRFGQPPPEPAGSP